MAIKLTNKLNTAPVSASYPFGNIKDRVGATAGTAVNTVNHADFHQFFEKLMNEAGIAHNNLPDNATNGFQLFSAFKKHLDEYLNGYFTANFGTIDNTKLYILGIGARGRVGGGGDYGIDTPNSGIAYYNGTYLYIDPTVTTFGFGIGGQQPKIIKTGPVYMLTTQSNVLAGDLIPYIAFENLPNNVADSDIRPRTWVNMPIPSGAYGNFRYRYLNQKTVLVQCQIYNVPASTAPTISNLPAPAEEIAFVAVLNSGLFASSIYGNVSDVYGNVFISNIPATTYSLGFNLTYCVD